MFATLALALGTLTIAVSGNHFVNQNGQTVRLLGVDHPGTEYACQQGWGYSQDALDTDVEADQAAAITDAAAIASWNANAVRVPLNEDCWLGINGQPSFGTKAGYQQYIEDWVSDLNADGIYAILDLHWSAPGSTVASGQWPMADQHSLAFWTSVAGTFKDNHAVLFDAFNEPYSPASTYYGDSYASPLTWDCWLDGGCTLQNSADGDAPTSQTPTYTPVGMQQIVDAIRNAGASQPVLLGGLAYSNDLTGWLAHEPNDPDQQLAASLHAYEGNACDDVSCFNAQVGPVAAQVPVVISEFDETQCPTTGDDDFDQDLMDWADGEGVSYLAWGWYAGSTLDCSDTGYFLTDGAGNPDGVNGTLLKSHLATVSTVTGSVSGSTIGSGAPTKTPAGSADSSSSTGSGSGSSSSTGAKGKAARCTVPGVLGDHLAQARRRLLRAHCRVGPVVYRKLTSSSAASGRRAKVNVVTRESPAAGRSLREGARVALVICKR